MLNEFSTKCVFHPHQYCSDTQCDALGELQPTTGMTRQSYKLHPALLIDINDWFLDIFFWFYLTFTTAITVATSADTFY
jgi:hypothetical protein